MSWCLVPVRILGGVWEGRLSGPGGTAPPEIAVWWRGEEVARAEIGPEVQGVFPVRFEIPVKIVADGTQTLLVGQPGKAPLCKASFCFGDVLEDDLSAEVSSLRAELDLLKKAFRRHCVEDH